MNIEKPELNLGKILRDERGPAFQQLIDLIPKAMAEISEQMVNNPDSRIRKRLQMEMKALFDFMQSDTMMFAEPVDKRDKRDDHVFG